MKKYIVFLSAAILASTMLMAAPVDRSVTRHVAVNFWNTYRQSGLKPIDSTNIKLIENDDFPYIDIYSVDGTGFVVVAADNSVPPVLAYSFDSPAKDEMHISVKEWMSDYNRQIALAYETGQEARPEVAAMWQRLLTDTAPEVPLSLTDIPAMLETTWDQGDPYNKFCPFDSNYNERTVVGCTATAMAQLMKYWNYPAYGDSSHSYTHQLHEWAYDYSVSYGTLNAGFERTTYIWEYMTPALIFNSPRRNIDAVALLSYHCGISVDMQYGPSATGGSGAWTISYGDSDRPCSENALRDYFKYDPSLHGEERSSYSFETWKSMIDADLEAGRPILYTGSDDGGGHAFVLDGSDLDGRYHFNWGWSGAYDGFFRIDSLYLGGGGIGTTHTYSFNYYQTALFNVFPGTEEVFDTVDRHDTVCNNEQWFQFYEYELPVEDSSYVLRHLDTVFRLDVAVMRKRYAYFDPNGGDGSRRTQVYCPVSGLEMPENTFNRDGYKFMGWSTSATGADVVYQPGEVAPIRYNVLFYAVWRDTNDLAGINAASSDGVVDVWPNPTLGRVTIELGHDDCDMTLFEVCGRVVMRKKGLHGKAEIDLEGLPAGVYLMRLSNKNGVSNIRVIKE